MANSSPSRAFDPEHVSERGNPDLIAVIRAEIDAAGGRIPFARFMELALYHPVCGYYLSPLRRPGRPGDFLTAPETPLLWHHPGAADRGVLGTPRSPRSF